MMLPVLDRLSGRATASRGRLILIGAIWFVACLLWTAPARLAASLAMSALPPLQLQNVSGSFWHGNAGMALWRQGDRAVALGALSWRIRPWSLLWLHPQAHIAANYGDQFVDAQVRVSPLGAVVLRDVSAALPASLLSQFAPLPASGLLGLRLDRAELDRRQQLRAVHGTLSWQTAQWQWNSHWIDLGDYRCVLQMPNPQQLQCALQGQGALALNGDLAVDFKARTYALQARVKADAALPESFRQVLTAMLGAQLQAGRMVPVKRSGSW